MTGWTGWRWGGNLHQHTWRHHEPHLAPGNPHRARLAAMAYVVVVIQLGDEGEVAGDLPVVGDLELLLLQLTELHVLKFKLQSKEKTQTRLAARRGHMGRPPDSVAAARDGKCPHNVKLPAEDLPRSQAKMSLLIQLLSIR